MKGIVFNLLRTFLESEVDAQAWPQAVEKAGIPAQEYQDADLYPDIDQQALLEAVAVAIARPVDEALTLFGRSMAEGLVAHGLDANLLQADWTTLDVLEFAEALLFGKVDVEAGGGVSPDLRTARIRRGELALACTKRNSRLCHLIKGLQAGLAAKFDEPVDFNEPICQDNGAPLCRFSVFIDDPDLYKLADVSRELEVGGRISLFNQYQGVSVTHPATVMELSKESVVLKTHPHQLAAMQEEGQTFIAPPGARDGLSAWVEGLFPDKGSIALKEVSYADGVLGKRIQSRVNPDTAVHVDLIMDNGELLGIGQLVDISLGGASVSVGTMDDLENSIFANVWVGFELPLTSLDGSERPTAPQELEGNIMGVNHRDDGTSVIRVMFWDLLEGDRILVEEYVKQRQRAIQPLLEEAAQALGVGEE